MWTLRSAPSAPAEAAAATAAAAAGTPPLSPPVFSPAGPMSAGSTRGMLGVGARQSPMRTSVCWSPPLHASPPTAEAVEASETTAETETETAVSTDRSCPLDSIPIKPIKPSNKRVVQPRRAKERRATDGSHSGFCGQAAAAAVAEPEPPLSLARRLAQQFQGEVVTSPAAPSSFMTALVAVETETAVETSLEIGDWGCSGGGDGDADAAGASPPAGSPLRARGAAGTLGSLSPPPSTTFLRASPQLGSDSPPSLASPLPGGVLCR